MAKTLTSVALLLLGTGIAGAADLPALPPLAPLATPFSFTGLYLGGNLGVAWAQSNATDSLFGMGFADGSSATLIGGGQVGFNYQFGRALVGIEGDADWTANNRGTDDIVSGPLGSSFRLRSNDTWISTIAARFGYVAQDCLLLYGKVGAGWVGDKGFVLTDMTTAESFRTANNTTNTGWLLGAGVEWALTPQWTVKLEYDYLGIERKTFLVSAAAIPALAGDTFTIANRNVQMVKLGANYLFNWGDAFADRY